MISLFKRRYLIYFVLIPLCNLSIAGCYSAKEITVTDDKSVKVLRVDKKNGEIIDFTDDPKGYAIISDSSIIRTDQNNLEEKIPLSEIKTIYADKFDPDKTFYLVIGTIFGIGLLLVLAIYASGGIGPYGG